MGSEEDGHESYEDTQEITRNRSLRTFSFHDYKIPPRKTLDFTLLQNLVIGYQSLGVVYGDIGTSPLYVFSSMTLSEPGEKDFLGILSLIFWTLTMMGMIKYVFIVLHADDHGEGALLPADSDACFTNLFFNILTIEEHFDGKMMHNTKMHNTNILYGTLALYSLLRQHVNFNGKMMVSTERLSSDLNLQYLSKGSKLQSKAKKFLEENSKVQALITFIVLLGTCMVIGDGALTPAISVLSAVQGIQSRSTKITQGHVVILSVAILVVLFLFQRFGTRKVSFSFSPIMVLWFSFSAVIGLYNIIKFYPLILKAMSPHYIIYFFQRNHRKGWELLGAIALCITAVVASQALISASFSIIRQSIGLGCFPRVTMIHTSGNHEGQVYSPEVNYFLMIMCILITVGFNGRAEIGNAFGVAVIWVMLITTFLMAVVMLVIWDTNIILVVAFLTVFASIEGIYMSSLLNKFAHGGWVPFAISAFFLVISLSWAYGRSQKSMYEDNNRMIPQELNQLVATSIRVPGICIFCTDLVNGIPPIIRHYVQRVGTLRAITVLVTVRTVPVRTVLPEERFLVVKLEPEGVYRCLVLYGYMDEQRLDEEECVSSIVARLEEIAANAQEVEMLNSASCEDVIFVLGRIILNASVKNGCFKKWVISKFYRFLQKNFRSNAAALRIPPSKSLQMEML